MPTITKYRVPHQSYSVEFPTQESATTYCINNQLDPGIIQEITEPLPEPSSYDLDMVKYLKRAQVRDALIAEMAAGNMSRVRAGIWTVNQLIELTQDSELKLVLDDVNTLSFELAISKITAATNPLLIPEIKQEWIDSLQRNLFL